MVNMILVSNERRMQRSYLYQVYVTVHCLCEIKYGLIVY